MALTEVIEKALQARDTAQRTALLAAELGAYFGKSTLVACWLQGPAGVAATAIDADRSPLAETADRLRQEALAAQRDKRALQWEALSLNGTRLVAADVKLDSCRCGSLIVSAHESAAEELLENELGLWAGCLGVRLALEAANSECERLRAKLQHERFLADIGQIARPVVHELYNLLNTMSLQVEVLKLKFPAEAVSADFSLLKKQVVGMVDVLKWFRNYRNALAPSTQPVDMIEIIRETVANLWKENALPANVTLDLQDQPAIVVGSEVDAERVLRFLLANTNRNEPISIAAHTSDNKLKLTMQTLRDNPGWELHQFLEVYKDSKEMCGPLELTAFKMLLERFRGRLTTEAVSDNGVRAIIELPLAKST